MKVSAFAKLNLTLEICGKRQDGYHLLDSVMQSVDIADILTVEKADNISFSCSDVSLQLENNTCIQAAGAFFAETGIMGGVNILLEKHIPKAAGMGGGSADAAAVIRALDKIYETDLDDKTMIKIALTVGADVPFCLFGGTARVGGIGEKIEPLRLIPDCFIVGFKDGQKSSTGEMYRAIDACNIRKSIFTDHAVLALENQNLKALGTYMLNDFLTVEEHTDAIQYFVQFGALGATLSGSGPTVFGIFNHASAANEAKQYFCEIGKDAFIAHPKDCGVSFE